MVPLLSCVERDPPHLVTFRADAMQVAHEEFVAFHELPVALTDPRHREPLV
jgi:hypothetical protein